MTALVIGATGFVGREVVRQLCVRATATVAHVRPDSRELPRWQQTFGALGATVDTTPWEAAALTARIRELAPAQIYICIGTTRKKAKAEQLAGNIYETIDYGLTKLAVDAARASETSPRIIYLSSVGANAASSSAYLAWRGKAEAAVSASGLPYIIARPATIHGDRDEHRAGEAVASVVGDGVLAVVGLFGGKGVRAKYRSTSPDVLAAALIRLGEQPAANLVADGDLLR